MPSRPVRRILAAALAVAVPLGPLAPLAGADDLYPKHLNAAAQATVKRGLDYLAATQNDDGFWNNAPDGQNYPTCMAALAGMAFLAHGDTPSRGPYAANIRKVELYLLGNARSSGLITSPVEEGSKSMHSHGFALLFLASVYGMESDAKVRDQIKKAVTGAIGLTCRAQSDAGGWTYIPGGGDEGSVTVTQMQGLRAAQNAGFNVPKGTVANAVHYLEKCRTSEGGIEYSLGSGGGARLPISAAAVRHAVQRRRVRQQAGRRLPGVRRPVLRPVQGAVEQGDGPRVLPAPVRRPGVLPGRRQVLGRLLSGHPRPTDEDAERQRQLGRRRHRPRLRGRHRLHHPAAAVQVPPHLPEVGVQSAECTL